MIRLPCRLCGTVDYPKWKYLQNGIRYLARHCILCQREKWREREERDRNNPKRVTQKRKAIKKWMKRNIKRCKKAAKLYSEKHKERIRLRHHYWYLANKKRLNELGRLWRLKNRKKKRGYNNKKHVWRRMETLRVTQIMKGIKHYETHKKQF